MLQWRWKTWSADQSSCRGKALGCEVKVAEQPLLCPSFSWCSLPVELFWQTPECYIPGWCLGTQEQSGLQNYFDTSNSLKYETRNTESQAKALYAKLVIPKEVIVCYLKCVCVCTPCSVCFTVGHRDMARWRVFCGIQPDLVWFW